MNARDAKRRADKIVDGRINKLGRALGLEAMQRVMDKTPVDTGHARGNWNASVGAPDFSVVGMGQVDGSGFAQGARRKGGVVIDDWDMAGGDALHVANGVPYIVRLEEGWSGQAPSGMARVTVQELKPMVGRIARIVSRMRGDG